jgi:FtsZ-binding cell division protein ZapB
VNALEFLKQHEAQAGDVLVFKYRGAPRVAIVFKIDGQEYELGCPGETEQQLLFSQLEPIALYRAAELWDPKWWTKQPTCGLSEISPELVARAEPYFGNILKIDIDRLKDPGALQTEAQYHRDQANKLAAENASLKAQLAERREDQQRLEELGSDAEDLEAAVEGLRKAMLLQDKQLLKLREVWQATASSSDAQRAEMIRLHDKNQTLRDRLRKMESSGD